MNPTPAFYPVNILGAPGPTMAGIAAAAPALLNLFSNMQVPTNAAGWMQLGFGALALFARA